MTLDLEPIRRRAEAATPEPWIPAFGDIDIGFTMQIISRAFDVKGPHVNVNHFGSKDAEADCYFIAHAREDIPALIQEVEQLRAKLKVAVDLIEEMDEPCGHKEVQKFWKEHGPGRFWCLDCSSYVRTENDLTLRSRLREALSKIGNDHAE